MPSDDFTIAQKQLQGKAAGALYYEVVDVAHTDDLNRVIANIADKHGRLDGVIAAAAVQKVCPATEYTAAETAHMMAINYTGVFMTATAAARQMIRFKSRGSIVLVASMSGIIANKGLLCPVYNSSKAAVTQLTRNLAMEWSKIQPSGTGGIRVNSLSPGHTITPMVRKNLEEDPPLLEKWQSENMMGRLAEPWEFKGAAVFLLSNASSFMTGNNLIIDGGHTAW